MGREKGMWKMIEPYKPLYMVEETATALMTSTDIAYSPIRRGGLRALRLGETRIRGSGSEQFVEDCPALRGEGQT